jgi:hypothetical protein
VGRRSVRWALAFTTVLACFATLAYAAVGSAGTGTTTGTPPTAGEILRAEGLIKDAIGEERKAVLDAGRKPRENGGVGYLAQSLIDLFHATETLSGRDLGPDDPTQAIHAAEDNDVEAKHAFMTAPEKALPLIAEALKHKKEALALLASYTVPPTTGTEATGPTASGQVTPSTEPGAVDVALKASTPINAYRVQAPGRSIASRFAPKGFTCTNPARSTVVCKGGARVAVPFTSMIGYAGTIPPSLSVAVSTNGGRTFGPFATLTSHVTSTPTPSSTPGGSTASIGPLEACVDVSAGGSVTVENVEVLDAGATGLKGTVTFDGQGIDLTDPILFSTTGLTAAPFVVSKPGTATITITVPLPGGTSQHLTLTSTLGSGAKTSTGCAPHR